MMIDWQMSRIAPALVAATLMLSVAACDGGDRERAGVVGDTAATGAPAAATGTMSEAEAFNSVSAVNAAEISTSMLAQQRAQNSEVRQFAERMVNEHQEAQGRFDRVAMDLGVAQQPFRTDTLDGLFEERRRELDGLQAGPEFDRRYMELQVELHEGALQALNNATGVGDERMRTEIQNMIPTVQQHLDQARQLHAQLAPTGQAQPGTTPRP